MTPEILTQVYWLLASIAVGGFALSFGCWYGLRRMGPPEDI